MALRRTGVYPGSFNPPTIAHVAIAEAARRLCRLDTVYWVVSRSPLNKSGTPVHVLEQRMEVLRQVAARIEWLEVELSEHRFVVDIARGHDVVIMGADKWHQVTDPAYYDGPEARDQAVAALPTVAIAPRAELAVPPGAVVLDVPPHLHDVSSTRARAGHRKLMVPEAADVDEGLWW